MSIQDLYWHLVDLGVDARKDWQQSGLYWRIVAETGRYPVRGARV